MGMSEAQIFLGNSSTNSGTTNLYGASVSFDTESGTIEVLEIAAAIAEHDAIFAYPAVRIP